MKDSLGGSHRDFWKLQQDSRLLDDLACEDPEPSFLTQRHAVKLLTWCYRVDGQVDRRALEIVANEVKEIFHIQDPFLGTQVLHHKLGQSLIFLRCL